MKQEQIKEFIKKVNASKQGKMDLSVKEDMAIGIMNLISLEEHFFFTAQKTENDKYFDLLKEIRKIRTDLLKKIIPEYEGEVWCISKHLLAACMRVMECGTKYMGMNKQEQAKEMFKKSYDLFNLFWALNLNFVKTDEIKKIGANQINKEDKEKKKTMFDKLGGLVKKAIDCCIE